MEEEHLIYLFKQRFSGSLSAEEEAAFIAAVNDPARKNEIESIIQEILEKPIENKLLTDNQEAEILSGIFFAEPGARKATVKKIGRPLLMRWSIAASVVIMITAGIYYWVTSQSIKQSPVITQAVNIIPGKEGAILTLTDGSKLMLDSLGDGVVAIQNGTQAILKNGQLLYNISAATSGNIAYNTMTTPKGRQFHLRLPDGSGVWLNAGSTIRYPTVFMGQERNVELTGEAYFEITKNPKMPFRLSVNDKVEVEVLGTNFNVNAYKNEEQVATTLLQGSVKVSVLYGKEENITLAPGQQAQVIEAANVSSRSISVINDADLDKAVAWKNGLFNFEGSSLKEVMRQLERWYDIEVIYEKGVDDVVFVGKLSRNIPFNDLLDILKRMQVNYRLDGNRKLVIIR